MPSRQELTGMIAAAALAAGATAALTYRPEASPPPGDRALPEAPAQAPAPGGEPERPAVAEECGRYVDGDPLPEGFTRLTTTDEIEPVLDAAGEAIGHRHVYFVCWRPQ